MTQKIAKKDGTWAWPVDQTPPHPDADKDPMYRNRQQSENVADWIKGDAARGLFPTGQRGVKGVD